MNQPSSKPEHRHAELTRADQVTLDCEHILSRAGGDPQLLIQLCAAFLNELPERMESLRSALEDRNSLRIQRAVHQLRTCLVVFGAGTVSHTAEMLEAALLGGRKRPAQRECKRLKRQIHLLVPLVQRLMLEMSTPGSVVH